MQVAFSSVPGSFLRCPFRLHFIGLFPVLSTLVLAWNLARRGQPSHHTTTASPTSSNLDFTRVFMPAQFLLSAATMRSGAASPLGYIVGENSTASGFVTIYAITSKPHHNTFSGPLQLTSTHPSSILTLHPIPADSITQDLPMKVWLPTVSGVKRHLRLEPSASTLSSVPRHQRENNGAISHIFAVQSTMEGSHDNKEDIRAFCELA